MSFKILAARALAQAIHHQLETAPDLEAVRTVSRFLHDYGASHHWDNTGTKEILSALEGLDGFEDLRDHLSKQDGDMAYYAWSCRLNAAGLTFEALLLLSIALRRRDLKPAERAFCEDARDAFVQSVLGEGSPQNIKALLAVFDIIKAVVSPTRLPAEKRLAISRIIDAPKLDVFRVREAIDAAATQGDDWPSNDASAIDLDEALKGEPTAALKLADTLFSSREMLENHLAFQFVSYIAKTTDCAPVRWIVRCVRGNCTIESLSIDTSDITQYTVPFSFAMDDLPHSDSDALEAGDIIVAKSYPTSTGSRHSDRSLAIAGHKALAGPVSMTRLQVDIDDLQAKLMAEFPWMGRITDLICQDLDLRRSYGQQAIHIPPLLLWGAPGTGKTRYCMRLAELLSLPFSALSFAGASDDRMLRGTGAGWGGAQPAFPVTKIAETHCANPMLLIDEIEKAASETKRNGDPLATLLMFLEPENARSFFDECLMTAVDLSHINWMATANSLKGLTQPLLSRLRVVETPAPAPEHITAIIGGVRRDFAREMGVDVRFVPELDEPELLFLEREFHKLPSVRTTIRMTQKLIRRRDKQLRETPN